MLQAILSRLLPPLPATTLRGTGRARTHVCPPKPFHTPPWWEADVGAWLRSGWPGRVQPAPAHKAKPASRTVTSLADIRREFNSALEDFRVPEAADLRARIRGTTSLRELWHLRVEVFHIVARQRDQTEANRRLARLNRHFPTRAPGSGFAALGAGERRR